jgi:UDP-glucose 4-epimerase
MKKGSVVAVTGGAGFIGSHTVDRLLEGGARAVVLDNFSTGRRENLQRWRGESRLRVLEVDVADGIFAPLAEVEREWGEVERIIHLSAQTSVVFSIENPLFDLRNNFQATAQVLEYARRRGVKKVVFASSAAVYGDVETLPVAESAECRPLSPYGINKLASELSLRYHSSVHGLACTPLRFFNVYGPRQDPSSPYSGVISIFVDRAHRGDELLIFGDGGQTRDFVYVGDVARAVVQACFSDTGDGAPANIGTGTSTTVLRLAEIIIELCGGRTSVRHASARDGEIRESVASIKRAKELFDFSASVALESGLRETVKALVG